MNTRTTMYSECLRLIRFCHNCKYNHSDSEINTANKMMAIHTPIHLLVSPNSFALYESGNRSSTTAAVSLTSIVAIMFRICYCGLILLLDSLTNGVANDSALRTTVKRCDKANCAP